jgi:hypothetical protein
VEAPAKPKRVTKKAAVEAAPTADVAGVTAPPVETAAESVKPVASAKPKPAAAKAKAPAATAAPAANAKTPVPPKPTRTRKTATKAPAEEVVS